MPSSGYTHLKYDHYHYPRLIELRCPSCDSKATAINISADEQEEYFIDLAPYDRIWEFNCLNCIKRNNIEWEDIQEYELWNSLRIRKTRIWAWNKYHLELIYLVLKKKKFNNHKWEFFKNYINKDWYHSIKNKSDFKKIEDLLQ